MVRSGRRKPRAELTAAELEAERAKGMCAPSAKRLPVPAERPMLAAPQRRARHACIRAGSPPSALMPRARCVQGAILAQPSKEEGSSGGCAWPRHRGRARARGARAQAPGRRRAAAGGAAARGPAVAAPRRANRAAARPRPLSSVSERTAAADAHSSGLASITLRLQRAIEQAEAAAAQRACPSFAARPHPQPRARAGGLLPAPLPRRRSTAPAPPQALPGDARLARGRPRRRARHRP